MIVTASMSRILAAVRPLDATTGLPLGRPLTLSSSAPLDVVPNRSGMLVIRALPGFDTYRDAWDSFSGVLADELVPKRFDLLLADPLGQYLPRRVSITLPRPPEAPARSLYTPVDVRVYPSPAAPPRLGWGVVRVSVRTPEDTDVPGALLRVERPGAAAVDGQTDLRGEGVLFVPGIRLSTWSDDTVASTVIERDVAVTIRAWFNPADLDAGGRRVRPLDPDLSDLDRAALRTAYVIGRLASGGALNVRLSINTRP